jgi:hypothetical protein
MRRRLRAWLCRQLRTSAPAESADGDLCPHCQRPIPPRLPPLAELVLGELDRVGATSAEQTARRLRRRTADVRAAFHELASIGLVRLEQPTPSPRSRRWAVVAHENGDGNGHGRVWDARVVAPATSADWISQSVFFAAGKRGGHG